MIRIDPLYIFILVEVLAALCGVTVYLFIRLQRAKRMQAELIKKTEDAFISLKKLLDDRLTGAQHEGRETEDRHARETAPLRVGFIQSSMDAVARGCASPSDFWQAIYKCFEETTNTLISERLSLQADKEESLKQLQEMTASKDSVEKAAEEQFISSGQEVEKLKVSIKELEDALAAREKAMASLQAQFDSLEQEYLVLYKEGEKA